jgi:hypothetical protein
MVDLSNFPSRCTYGGSVTSPPLDTGPRIKPIALYYRRRVPNSRLVPTFAGLYTYPRFLLHPWPSTIYHLSTMVHKKGSFGNRIKHI